MENALDAMLARGEHTFWNYLGCEYISGDQNEVKIELDAQEHHTNSLGIIHGGVLTSLMDQAMGMVATARKNLDSCVTTNLNVHFMSPMKQGRLFVSAIILHEAGRSLTSQARIHDSEGNLGCMATGSFRVIQRKS
ncbi:PaaI family thioesterase [Paenibacillus pini]|uniref:Acyl-coenzyme A thioesterase THEM4 n=1 Tax=Paenibacillus pini JCM 16418 TaxID=1236976 RepID=W7YQS3_9BACL|nr:PaaI family thioesterase [Paenibacillus pini]GAF09778.1 phenylacetic acid degradation protein paaI [Paenibacillus pini JCM 16418]